MRITVGVAGLTLLSILLALAGDPAVSSQMRLGVKSEGVLAAKASKASATKTAKITKNTNSTKTNKKPRVTTKTSSWRILSIASKGLTEVSGCAISRRDPNRVWLHNDADDGPYVIAVDITSGIAAKAVRLKGIDVVDPEDIAITRAGELILADIGDNALARESVQLYRFPEPPANATSALVSRLDLKYPNGAHNAEALIVSPDGSAAFIVTKEPSGLAQVFHADLTATGPQVLTLIGQVKIAGEVGKRANLISAADATSAMFVVRTYQFGYLFKIPSGGTVADAFRVTPRRFDVPSMVQGEALCIDATGKTMVTASESRGAANFALAIGPTPE